MAGDEPVEAALRLNDYKALLFSAINLVYLETLCQLGSVWLFEAKKDFSEWTHLYEICFEFRNNPLSFKSLKTNYTSE